MEKTLLEYGVVGAILLYFLWKDSKTFEIYRTTMQKIVDQLEAMQKDQTELKKDMEEIKKIIKEWGRILSCPLFFIVKFFKKSVI